MATFDDESAKRIAKAVRGIESMGGSMQAPEGAARSPMKSPGAVMVIGARNAGNGWFPGKYVYFNQDFRTCNATTTSTTTGTTTSTTTTTTSTTPPPPSTTQNVPFLNFSNLTTPDCWVMIKESDVATVEVGDVFDGHTVNVLAEDGLPVFLVSYSLAGTCPGTTTTTVNPCSGRCRWNWDGVSGAWVFADSTCASGCTCPYPPQCSDTACGVALTSCYSGLDFPPTNPCGCIPTTTAGPTTTGTGTTSTTTSTTPGPSCRGCYWKWLETSGWILTVRACSGTGCSDSCATPTGGGTNCATTITPCGPTTTTTPAPGCSGQCNYLSDGLNWILINNQCRNRCAYGTCDCRPPSFAPTACADRVSTPCLCPSNPGTTGVPGGGTTTTTTTLGPCTTTTRGPDCVTGQCKWAWNAGSSSWVLRSTNCATFCQCAYPGGIGSYECEIKLGPCNGTTTTSTTTTSTTTTSTTTTTTATPCNFAVCSQRVVSCSTGTGPGGTNEVTLAGACETSGCSGTVVTGNCGCAAYGKLNIGTLACILFRPGACYSFDASGTCGTTTTTVSPTTTTTSTTTPCPTCSGNCSWRCNYKLCRGVYQNCWGIAGTGCDFNSCCQCDYAINDVPCDPEGSFTFYGCLPLATTTTTTVTTSTTPAPGTTPTP